MKQYSEGILQVENMLLFAKIKWYDKALFIFIALYNLHLSCDTDLHCALMCCSFF